MIKLHCIVHQIVASRSCHFTGVLLLVPWGLEFGGGYGTCLRGSNYMRDFGNLQNASVIVSGVFSYFTTHPLPRICRRFRII